MHFLMHHWRTTPKLSKYFLYVFFNVNASKILDLAEGNPVKHSDVTFSKTQMP